MLANPGWLLSPPHLRTISDLVASDLPTREPGVYGWYFDALPSTVPVATCHRRDGWALAYVGIAPKAPPSRGLPSRQTLRTRVRYHFRGNAEGSTLRLTLGCLLASDVGLELRRVGSGRRMTFHTGERTLSEWMARHARVVFAAHQQPWVLEEQLIAGLSLPLNLAGNQAHPFHATLSSLRARWKEHARKLQVLR